MFYVVFALLAVIAFFVVLRIARQAYREQTEAHDQLKNCVSYNSQAEILTISRRDPNFEKVLKIMHYKKAVYGHTPEKLVYTGATVGGVTTGGVHMEGGYSVKEGVRSGKFSLYYLKDGVLEVPVKRISLSTELAEEARLSSIKEYITGTQIILFDKVEFPEAAAAAMRAGLNEVAFNLREQAKVDAAPTYEKCISIVNWLSGNNE